MTTKTIRRFVREPNRIAEIRRWMDRDFDALKFLAQLRFLTSTQLVALVGGSRRKVLLRLEAMYHHGYIDRPHVQMDLWRGGVKDYVYSITRKGIRKLKERGVSASDQLSLTFKEPPKRSAHVLHTLDISSVYVALDQDRKAHEIDELEWFPDGKPLRDRVGILVNGRKKSHPINPDGFVPLRRHRSRLPVVIEVDEDNETIDAGIEGGDPSGKDFNKKLRAFWQWGYVEKRHRQHKIYGHHAPKGFVVLITVPNEQRKKQILSLRDSRAYNGKLRRYPLPRTDMFWVAEYGAHTEQSIYELEWETFKGTKTTILDSLQPRMLS